MSLSSVAAGAPMHALQAVFDGLPGPALIKDSEHRWVLLNEKLSQLMGRPAEEVLGRSEEDLFPGVEGELRITMDDRVLRTGEELEYEQVVTSPGNGTTHHLRTHKRRLLFPCGAAFILVTLEDVTAAREAEAKLAEAEEHHRHAIELNPQIPWSADPEGRIIEVGPAWESRVGMPAADALNRGWMRAVHPEDIAAATELWRQAILSGERLDTEYRLRMAAGDYRWVRAWAAPGRRSTGEVARWYGTLEDIHDRKLAEAALKASSQAFSDMANAAPAMIWTSDSEGRTTFLSRHWRQITGQSEEQVLGHGWLDAVHPDDREKVASAFAAASAAGALFNTDYRLRDWTGAWRSVIDVGQPRHGPTGEFLGYVGAVLDVTERRVAEAEAARAAERISNILESTTDCVLLIDRDYRITYANGNARRMLDGRTLTVGKSLFDIYPEEKEGVFARHYAKALAEQTPVSFEAYLASLGEWLEVHAFPTSDGLSLFFRDVTARRTAEQERLEAEERMRHLARHDVLTGLANRLLFRERLEHVLSDRRAEGMSAVLYLDLDGFKEVNDAAGHSTGDVLLRLVAQRLQQSVRGADTVARLGGDEFAIIQTGVLRAADAADLAERILKALAEPFEVEGRLLEIGASIGIALWPGSADGPEELLRMADMALFRVKAESGGGYRFFEAGMDEETRRRQALKLAMHGALKRDEFSLAYQPMVDLGAGEVRGFEALMRWNHPQHGAVTPTEFIPIAEGSGLLISLGAWALREACHTAASWPKTVQLSVNLSPVQFRSPGLVAAVEAALAEAGLEPERLQLEITESAVLRESSTNHAVLQALRGLGVRIALDDFGTGYSSLSYLHRFQFDKIKLDRSFVQDLFQGREAKAIVKAVAGIADGLGVTLTAEGVETARQAEFLRRNGYLEGQGYYFSRPVQAAEIPALIGRPFLVPDGGLEAEDAAPCIEARGGGRPAPLRRSRRGSQGPEGAERPGRLPPVPLRP